MKSFMLGMMENKMKSFSGSIFLLIFMVAIVVVSFFICVSIAGLMIGSANAWILGGSFSDAWHLAWENKFVAFAWFILFVIINSIPFGVRK